MDQTQEYWKARALKAETELRDLREDLIASLNELQKQIFATQPDQTRTYALATLAAGPHSPRLFATKE